MTNGRVAHGIPIWFLSSGPEIPSVAGRNLFFPPIEFHRASSSFTKAPVAYMVGVIVVPTPYRSGPFPDTTEVSTFVTSSFAEAKYSHWTSAPVWALNWAEVPCCQALDSVGNCGFTPTSTCSVLPAPLPAPPLAEPPPLLPPPQAASMAASVAEPASANVERLLIRPISEVSFTLAAGGTNRNTAGCGGSRFPFRGGRKQGVATFCLPATATDGNFLPVRRATRTLRIWRP